MPSAVPLSRSWRLMPRLRQRPKPSPPLLCAIPNRESKIRCQGMIGNSRIMQPVYRLARLLAPRSTTVLITGPTGCGKEIMARAIHQLSPRAAATFAVVNCAAIPETLLEAELFGYSRGAFTGAIKSYSGRIQTAQGGTLFLDEIGEMPLSLQPKLLRFLEQKELQRLGSAEVVRVASATDWIAKLHWPWSVLRFAMHSAAAFARLTHFSPAGAGNASEFSVAAAWAKAHSSA